MTITCADCGSTQSVPELPVGASAACHRCHRRLARHTGRVELPLACAAGSLLLLPPAFFLPLMDSTIKNLVFEESRLVSSVPVIYSEVWFPFAFGFFFFAFLFPAIRTAILVAVLGAIRWHWRLPDLGRLFRWSEELRVWSMTDVVVIAGLVAYFRASIPADVSVRVGAWSYLALAALAVVGDHSLDRRTVWNAILPDRDVGRGAAVVSCGTCELTAASGQASDRCPRCGARLDRDLSRRFTPAIVAVAAAIPLAIPSYSFSIIVNDQLTGVWEHTVLGTVQLLADRGYWQYGVVMFFAGVVIPAVEIVGILWLLLRVRYPSRRGLVLRTRVYRLLHRLVRWPMIIPFIAAIAAPIVNFRGIDDIVAGPGATPLFLLLALVMLAVRLFEPRMMWKTAGELP
jgi:paraquat-inducible protein A